ncbi:MAG: hypothetical protein Q7R92_01780 [bacterium]|nr:hypothetical protein [bacterium]
MLEISNVAPHRMQKLVAMVFAGCLVVLFFSGFSTIKAKISDIKRRADINVLVKALDLYHDKYGAYPDSINDWQGWDLSIAYNGGGSGFLNMVKAAGLIDRLAADPINNASYHYRYQKYSAGEYGCKNSFYILQAVSFELPNNDNGKGQCPEFNWVESSPNGYTVQVFD